ncbi:ArsR family transcriptional regulator [Streptomyces sp. NPDC007162]|uniref:ArsR family transcriptional regulator n=1 Tax=Streptomyces sp. NPDC007162 TaxID=3156917 RepID=UPI0033C9A417
MKPHTGWTSVTNRARVLAGIADNHHVRIRDIAARCRLNQYRIDPGRVLRHPAEAGLTVASLPAMPVEAEAEHHGAPRPAVSPGAG